MEININENDLSLLLNKDKDAEIVNRLLKEEDKEEFINTLFKLESILNGESNELINVLIDDSYRKKHMYDSIRVLSVTKNVLLKSIEEEMKYILSQLPNAFIKGNINSKKGEVNMLTDGLLLTLFTYINQLQITESLLNRRYI